jgi:hypothetical protein
VISGVYKTWASDLCDKISGECPQSLFSSINWILFGEKRLNISVLLLHVICPFCFSSSVSCVLANGNGFWRGSLQLMPIFTGTTFLSPIYPHYNLVVVILLISHAAVFQSQFSLQWESYFSCQRKK